MTGNSASSPTVAIMQPTYLPWLGYFDLIDTVDIFVVLDNAQFEKQTWQQRNQLRSQVGLEWITVPVLIKDRFGQRINQVEINRLHFIEKHLKQITQNYRKAQWYGQYYPRFSEVFQTSAANGKLAHFTIEIIKSLCTSFNLSASFVMASDLAADGVRSEKLVNIMQALGAKSYISPKGAAEYIFADYTTFKNAGVSVFFQNYQHPVYNQIYTPFTPYACALDLLFNEGAESTAIIRSGRKILVPAETMVNL